MVHQHKWYVVITGTEPGIYSSWIEAGPKTKNIPGGSIHQCFPSEAEAIRVFEAAKARGDVKAHPLDKGRKDRSVYKSKDTPLSPLGMEAALLMTPFDLKGDTTSTGLQAPAMSSVHSRAAKLRRTLKDSANSCSTLSSPPTGVTRALGYAPLYEDDSPPNSPVARPPPHFTFASSGSRAYPVVAGGYLLETKGFPSKLEVSDWGSPPSTPSSSDLQPGAEEHTSNPARCIPPRPAPSPRSKGVEYRSLSDFADMESIDPRVWLPKSRVFDPDKVKPRPLTRPASPVKVDRHPVPNHEVDGNSQLVGCQISVMDSPFVRAGRGRHSRLTPSWSLPDQKVEDNCSSFGSPPTQLPENHRTAKGKRKEMDCSACDAHPAEGPMEYGSSPRNTGRSHVQLVPRDDGDEQSVITVHCPASCPHETCYRRPLTLSVPSIESPRRTGSRYVDACVSPIITITGRIIQDNSETKNRHKIPDLDRDHPYEAAGFTHVSHKGLAPEADVRSPIARGTMIPLNAAETLFGRPSPQVRVSDLQVSR